MARPPRHRNELNAEERGEFERLLGSRVRSLRVGAEGRLRTRLRLGHVAWSTKDADFEWRLNEEHAVELLLDAAALDLGDRFTVRAGACRR